MDTTIEQPPVSGTPPEIELGRTPQDKVVLWWRWFLIVTVCAVLVWVIMRGYEVPRLVEGRRRTRTVYETKHLPTLLLAVPLVIGVLGVWFEYLRWKSEEFVVTTFRVGKIRQYPAILFWMTDTFDSVELSKIDYQGVRRGPLYKFIGWLGKAFGRPDLKQTGTLKLDTPAKEDVALNAMKWMPRVYEFEELIVQAKRDLKLRRS